MPKKQILNIQDTVKRSREQGMPLSEYCLRRAIRSGAIPCRRVGRTYLICWSNVERWLLCEDGADNAKPVLVQSGGIRKLDA